MLVSLKRQEIASLLQLLADEVNYLTEHMTHSTVEDIEKKDVQMWATQLTTVLSIRKKLLAMQKGASSGAET